LSAGAGVAGRDDGAAALAPHRKDSADRFRCEVGPIGERYDGCLDTGSERIQAATQGGSRSTRPVRTIDDPCSGGLEGVCAGDDDDLVHRAFLQPVDHPWEKELLLRPAEPRPGAGREHDGRDHPWVVTARMSAMCTSRNV
jgi:hypothetical protein